MKRWWSRVAAPLGVSLVLAVALQPGAARAQGTSPSSEYQIGVEDVLQISVWMHPELERTVPVNAQGNVVMPPVGEIKAAGLTTQQLAERITDRLSTYLHQTATVTVTVREFLSHSVYVSGAVVQPGRYGFETIPGLMDVINRAGGPQANADLNRILIVRREGPGRGQTTADLGTALRNGTEQTLPPLAPGDVIVVPATGMATSPTMDAAGVIGEVNRPGLYPVGIGGEDLWMMLALAGGPTARGNLSNIRVLTRDQDAQTAVLVNLFETLQRGNKSPYRIKPGDIVFVDAKGPSAWGLFTGFLGVTRDVASLIAVVDILRRNKTL